MTPQGAGSGSREPPDRVLKYILDKEQLVDFTRRHPIVVYEPVGSAIGGLLVLLWLSGQLPEAPEVRVALFVGWLLLVARAGWRLLQWSHDWFVVTNKRLLLTGGTVTRQVDQMPLSKVTDMRYKQSLAGMVLDYGQFILESAGQKQALRNVSWLPNPDTLYHRISGQIYTPGDDRAEHSRRVEHEHPSSHRGPSHQPGAGHAPLGPGGHDGTHRARGRRLLEVLGFRPIPPPPGPRALQGHAPPFEGFARPMERQGRPAALRGAHGGPAGHAPHHATHGFAGALQRWRERRRVTDLRPGGRRTADEGGRDEGRDSQRGYQGPPSGAAPRHPRSGSSFPRG